MFYRRKFYTVKSDFVEVFNTHFNHTNLPSQLKYGSRLIGRWMKENKNHTVEIFAIWEYDSYEDYVEIENNVRSDEAHVKRVRDWYEKYGGREFVYKEYILEVRNEQLESTLEVPVQQKNSCDGGGFINTYNPTKIHIIGSVGSGKTTLAKKLSKTFSIPLYEIDNVVWKRDKSGDSRRTEEEREAYFTRILQTDTWVVEGVHNEEWVAPSFEMAEVIIFLDTNYSVRTYRIIKRFILQKLRIEPSNYKPTLPIFFKMFKWNRYFEDVGKPNFYKKFGIYNHKIVVVTKKKEIKKYFNC